MFHLKSLLFVIALGGATLLHAAPEDDLIRPVQDRWAEIKYKTPEKQQAELYRELAVQAHQISKNNPNLAAALVWEGIVVSSEAGVRGGLGGLSLAKDARTLLEESLYAWGDETGSNTVEVYIHHLRRKFGSDFIRTVRGLGYQLADRDA